MPLIAWLRNREIEHLIVELAKQDVLVDVLTAALESSTARNRALCMELQKCTALLKLMNNAAYGKGERTDEQPEG